MSDEHVLVNRASWDQDAPNWVERGRRSWAGDPTWGIWWIPESELGVLPDDLEGKDAIGEPTIEVQVGEECQEPVDYCDRADKPGGVSIGTAARVPVTDLADIDVTRAIGEVKLALMDGA